MKFAKSLVEGSFVVLEGYIIKRHGSENYLFKDGTGYISAEIDDDDLRYVTITSKTKVRIYGEIDVDLTLRKIEVERIELVE